MSRQYAEAGVDIAAGDAAVEKIAEHVRSTAIPGVSGEFGGFGGLFDLAAAGLGGTDLVLVSGADGVGTKLKIAFLTGRHDTIGIDCVAMCVNDILTQGARPLFFLDYLATGKLDPVAAAQVVAGVAAGCREAGCALLGGETAEMPGFYTEGEYDLAGFAVGAVERASIVDGRAIEAGDVLVGLPSSGFHSNGYSLLRKVLLGPDGAPTPAAEEAFGGSVLDALLYPTRIYVRQVLESRSRGLEIRGMVHITGGGLIGNIPRILPSGVRVELSSDVLNQFAERAPVPFGAVQQLGGIPESEMYEVFNMGVGFVVVVPTTVVDLALSCLGQNAAVLGTVSARNDEPQIEIR